jgi:hypothetical protein
LEKYFGIGLVIAIVKFPNFQSNRDFFNLILDRIYEPFLASQVDISSIFINFLQNKFNKRFSPFLMVKPKANLCFIPQGLFCALAAIHTKQIFFHKGMTNVYVVISQIFTSTT